MKHPTSWLSIGDSHIECTRLHYSLTLLQHFGHINESVLATKKGIYSWFIYYKVEKVGIIGHLSDIHYIPPELWTGLYISLAHLIYHYCRNVHIVYICKPLIIKIFCYYWVSTANVENLDFAFPVRTALINWHLLQDKVNNRCNWWVVFKPFKYFAVRLFIAFFPVLRVPVVRHY